MQGPIVHSTTGVTLVGGGELAPGALDLALRHAPRLVAADGGADQALAAGHLPDCAIGDFDSISVAAQARLGSARLHRITEQQTTDFDKALRSIAAPFVLALGFTGARLDHTLGAFDVLTRHPARRCILLGPRDLCMMLPPRLRLVLPPGLRLSLFPMRPVTGSSRGLRWPIDGIDFSPGGMTGLSNVVSGPEVELTMDAPGMLLLAPPEALEPVLRGLDAAG